VEVKEDLVKGTIMVLDILGKEVLQERFSGNTTQIHTGHLASGFYMIMVLEGDILLHTEKMIKAPQP